MKRDPLIFLQHILDSINLIETYLHSISEEEFKHSPAIQDQVLYRLVIVGEAVKNMPDNIKKDHTEVQWKAIAGMRDVLIHQYFGIDLDEVWLILTKRLPILKNQILNIIQQHSTEH